MLIDLIDSEWKIHLGDCIEHMPTMPDKCIDFAIFSPPFPALYAYTDSERDIGNSDDLAGETKIHLSFFYHQLARLIKPGRVVVVHVMQIPRLKRSGGVGLMDFRGLNIRLGERSGLIYEYDWSVAKNPQAQAIRTHSHELQFAGLERDRARCRGALADYLIKFTARGENKTPVQSPGDVSRNDWIDWAECCWDWRDVRATDTLNVRKGRDKDDVKHICPLQLPVIDRLVRLFTNPREIVFSPFAGIGSEGVGALRRDRRFYGIELKESYFRAMSDTLRKTVKIRSEKQTLLKM